MKTKAEDELLEFSSEESQSEDDEDGWKLTEDVEKEFFKTLSKIKNKDPKIYERNNEFFRNVPIPTNKVINSEKSNPITLRDYERNILLEKGGEFSDEEPLQSRPIKPKQPTYVEEQESLKNSLKAVVNSSSEDEDEEEWGGLLKPRQKNKEDEKKEEETYKEWLKGQKKSAPDEEIERDLKSLRDYWTSPNLNGDEQFLRDYVLNKKFLDHDDKDYSELDSNKLIEKEDDIQEQVELRNEYNHRFEEQDQEFIKRYPRQMENSLRRKNDHRKKKRDEVKERKLKEKEKKKAEIKNTKKKKRKEIEDKIEELKKLTGNKQLAFDNILDQDFDLDEHDKAMQRLFNEEFYSQDDPNFYPSGSTSHEDPWNEELHKESKEEEDNDFVNCEDPNFNMDCDYDPGHVKPKENISRSRRRKDKHRRTTVSEVVNQEKPVFDPTTHQSFQEYLDQYYAIDCEDFIGDLPCRFKYRRTVPNSYGLTIEEILAADDKELDRWCSIKRIQQLRPDFKEKGDVKVYKKKAEDEKLKRKILPSLFKAAEDSKNVDPEKSETTSLVKENTIKETHENRLDKTETEFKEENTDNKNLTIHKKKKKKSKRPAEDSEVQQKQDVPANLKRKLEITETEPNKKSKMSLNKKKRNLTTTSKKKGNKYEKHTKRQKDSNIFEISDARLLAYGIKPKKFRNKLKYGTGKV